MSRLLHPRKTRRGNTGQAVLIALLFVAGVALSLHFGNRASRRESNSHAPAPPLGTALRPTAGAALGTFLVKDVTGTTVPLVTAGEPAIIMVSSRTCEWCAQTLSDLRELAAGRALPRLKVLTLEGAREGVPMIAREGLKGVQLLGPADDTDGVFLTFRYPGTPTFLAVDRDGRVSSTMLGYLQRDVLRKWFNVMVGDEDTPQ